MQIIYQILITSVEQSNLFLAIHTFITIHRYRLEYQVRKLVGILVLLITGVVGALQGTPLGTPRPQTQILLPHSSTTVSILHSQQIQVHHKPLLRDLCPRSRLSPLKRFIVTTGYATTNHFNWGTTSLVAEFSTGIFYNFLPMSANCVYEKVAHKIWHLSEFSLSFNFLIS